MPKPKPVSSPPPAGSGKFGTTEETASVEVVQVESPVPLTKKQRKQLEKEEKERAKSDAKQAKEDTKRTAIQAKEDAKNTKREAKQNRVDKAVRLKQERRNSKRQANQSKIDEIERITEAKAAKKQAKKDAKKGRESSSSGRERNRDLGTESLSSQSVTEKSEKKVSIVGVEPVVDVSDTKLPVFVPDYNFTAATQQETWRARSAVTHDVKDLTLMISGLYDAMQTKRGIVLSLELRNSDLAKALQFQSDAYRLLRQDLRHIKRDYKTADREYSKGRQKVVENKHYLKKNAKLQGKIIENNVDLLAEMTVNDEVIPDVCRELRVRRLREQGRCLRQLRSRLSDKKDQLVERQARVVEEERNSDHVCRVSERWQRTLDDQGYVEHETYNVAQLRSVAYCLGYVQYQVDDLTSETSFTREMNSSRMNDFSNELNWRAMLYREKVQALQTTVATAIHQEVLGKATDKLAVVSSCLRHAIPEAQKEWLQSQISLSQVLQRQIEVEFVGLWVEIVYRNARLYGKLLSLRQRLKFTLGKREQFLRDTQCVAETSNRIYIYIVTYLT